jgi:adenosyl cobinamide kinase/adenosyl cobinamide phosphate guanylyltransferase
MAMTLLTGGARSGKSRLAVRLAAAGGEPVTFIATARAGDEEMAARIERHRSERPRSWNLIEEPVVLRGAVSRCEPKTCVVIDCLTLWVSNLMEAGASDGDIMATSATAAKEAGARPGGTIVVTNEVGSGIVPVSSLTRRFRDVLGTVNATWAEAAGRSFLVVAGKGLELTDLPIEGA